MFMLMVGVVEAQLKVVGYMYTNGDANVVDWSKITHLNLAFENPDAQGNLSFAANNATFIQKAHANNVKVLVSICGGAASNDATLQARYFSLISDANRAAFIAKIVQYLDDHGFDGIDLDLEGPAINNDYNKFVTDLDAALPEGMLLTAALSHLNNGDMVSSTAAQTFDFLNIMAYDATGPWNPGSPGQHSSYELATTSLAWWVDNKGLSKNKAILGVPFYGYGFGADANEGISYAEILSRFGAGAENRDESGNKIYYNGIPTIREKVRYVVDEEFGGIMIWQLAQDVATSNPKSLLRNIYEEMYNITGIEVDASSIFTISPNPTGNLINLNIVNEAFRNAAVRISDTSGRIFQGTFDSKYVINVSALPDGMYLLQLTNKQTSVVQKFTKR
jgi:GH18 family chitinase